MLLRRLAHATAFVAVLAASAAAQYQGRTPIPLTGDPVLDHARLAQQSFEDFRRRNLPVYRGRGASGPCESTLGNYCYFYDERLAPPPPEPSSIAAERAKLIGVLDSTAARYPHDDWTAGQRVRYLLEDGRPRDAFSAARACQGDAWWCDAITGLVLHETQNFASADSAFARALAAMPERLRCEWDDIGVLLDAGARMTYRRYPCGTPARAKYAERLWWLAKPLYASPGMDTRTEWYSRLTMVRMFEDAPNGYASDFNADEREFTLRYGWPRAWSTNGNDRDGNMMVTGHEIIPMYQYLPSAALANAPAMSDSTGWEDGVPPIQARYSPPHARRIHPLVHQSAMFRRGDSALVVLAWDAGETPAVADEKRDLAFVLARTDTSLSSTIARVPDAPLKGVLTSKGKWGPLLMSAEMRAPSASTAARARYGLRPPYAIGARVTLSEMLFFTPPEDMPQTLEQVLPHAMASIKIKKNQPLGVYFESYGTNPVGEMLKVTMSVAREEDEPGFMRRRAEALKLTRQATPVSVTVEDLSDRSAGFTARSIYLDVTSLRKGTYIVQLEVQVAGQYVVRTERMLEIID
jgi:hypothetical protein